MARYPSPDITRQLTEGVVVEYGHNGLAKLSACKFVKGPGKMRTHELDLKTKRPLFNVRRNEYGLWPSVTPLGIRYYQDPIAVGIDALIFKGYKSKWNWDSMQSIVSDWEVDEALVERQRKRFM